MEKILQGCSKQKPNLCWMEISERIRQVVIFGIILEGMNIIKTKKIPYYHFQSYILYDKVCLIEDI